MNEIETSLKSLNDWEYQLYLTIKSGIDIIGKKYKIEENELHKILMHFFLKAVEIIPCNKEEYLIVRTNEIDKLNSQNKKERNKTILRRLIFPDEPLYELNVTNTIEFLTDVFYSPLIKELRLIEENKRLKLEKSLLHNELEKDNTEKRSKPKMKIEDYINEVLQKGDIKLYKTELAKEIRKRILKKYPDKRYSVTTIRPKLSSIELY